MDDSLFRALADPTRRKILELLTEKDRTAGEIAEQFPIAFASVSHHLGVLKAADLVASEREGQFIRYRLNTTVFQEVVRYFMTRHGGDHKTKPAATHGLLLLRSCRRRGVDCLDLGLPAAPAHDRDA